MKRRRYSKTVAQQCKFYEVENIEVGKPINGRVVVNHHVELTEEEKQHARRDAMKHIENEAYSKMKQPKKVVKSTEQTTAPSLFDF